MSDVITVTEPNMIVVNGDHGPQGPGGPSADKHFSQPFTSQSIVTVTHNLGKYPAVTVLDSAGDECEGTVVHTSMNALTVYYSASFSGVITCN